MKEFWKEDFEIRYYQSDLKGVLSLQTLCHFLIETALYHAEDLGVSVEALQKNNLTWMLSRFLLEIDRLPVRQEKITVKTWPSGVKKLFSCRDFVVYDEREKEIARATTGWLVVDMMRRRPIRLPENVLTIQNNHAPGVIDRNYTSFPAENVFNSETEFKVRTSDIDINNHVTAVSYIDWIINSFSPDFYSTKIIRELEIEYRLEAVINERIKVQTAGQQPENGNTFIHRISNSADGKIHAIAATKWNSFV